MEAIEMTTTTPLPADVSRIGTDLEARMTDATDRLTATATALVIDSPTAADDASAMLGVVVKHCNEVLEYFKPMKEQAYRLHKEICGREKAVLDRLRQPERIIKAKLADYTIAVEHARREAQARARAEAEAQLAAERAEAVRAAEIRGDEEQARRIYDAPTPPVIVPPSAPVAPPVSGISTAEKWTAEVVDLVALCRAIGAGEAAPTLVKPNQAALNGLARSLKDALHVSGVRAVRGTIVRTRRT